MPAAQRGGFKVFLRAGLLLLACSAPAAWADVWGFIDAKGVAYFSTERVDERYELFYKGEESFDTREGIGAVNPPPRPQSNYSAPQKLVTFFDISPTYKLVKPHLREAASTHSIDLELLQAMIVAESGFDTAAVSPKGAIGLMQIMPATAERYGLASDAKTPLEKKLTDPKTNIRIGARYLRDLINMFPGKLDLAVASYNAGEGAIQKAGNQIPNYKETQNYVKTVLQLYSALKPAPAPVEQRRPQPTRVRMELPGGAIGRGNLPATEQRVSQTEVARSPVLSGPSTP
jgi:soluble lytic murein transglycosylase-like protein